MKNRITAFVLTVVMTVCQFAVITNGEENGDLAMQEQEIIAGKKYSFMNCDTGRMIRCGDEEYFTAEAVDNTKDTYYLSDKETGEYFSLENGRLIRGGIKQEFKIVKKELNRYTIKLADGNYLKDDDSGETNTAVIATDKSSKYIEYHWYITAEGNSLPKKIMPLGDSLTNGEDADKAAEERYGYRKLLSSLITESNGDFRFVFVGSQKSGGIAYGNSTSLYRHEGHNGYVINDIYGIEPHYGIYQNMTPWLEKYQPDIIFLMLGTNDIGLTWQSGDISKIDIITDNWELLVKTLLNTISDNGAVVAGAVPPIKNSEVFNSWARKFNSKILTVSKSLSNDNKEVIFADVNGAVVNNGLSDSFCSDGGHLNDSGYTAVANTFFEAFASSDTYKKICAEIEAEKATAAIPEQTSAAPDTADESKPSTNSSSAWRIAAMAGGALVALSAVIFALYKKKSKKKKSQE